MASPREAESATLPVTVVVPTVGRRTLAQCLASLAACRPRAAEVLVVVQGAVGPVEEMVRRDGPSGAHVVADSGRGVASGRNHGLRAARHTTVLITDDDCKVDPTWVAQAVALTARYPGTVLTGRVLPAGDPTRIPSCVTSLVPRDYTGRREVGALYPNNMVLPRDRVLAFGGFDERFSSDEAAEDCDFCYRWLAAGLPLRYEPDLVLRHDDWRTDAQLEALYVRYARGSGAVYGKHLRRGDPHIFPFLLRDLRSGIDGLRDGLAGRPRWSDPRQGILRGLPAGVLFGLRHLGDERSSPGAARAGRFRLRRVPSAPEQ